MLHLRVPQSVPRNRSFPLVKDVCSVENWELNCFKNMNWLMCCVLIEVLLETEGVQLCDVILF